MIKYQLPYKSISNAEMLLTIDIPSYEGDPINVIGVMGRACILDYEGGIDDIWDNPVVNVLAMSEIYNQGQVDVEELQLIEDRTAVVTVTRNGNIIFKGYLFADNMQRQLIAPPYNVTISATSGLNILEGIDFKGFGAELGTRCPLNYMRRILCHSQGLGIALPIRWSTSVQAVQAEISGDAMQNIFWSADGSGYSSYNPATEVYTFQNCLYVVEGLTKALQARIVQADGAWWIIGIKEHLNDVIDYYECATTSGVPIVTAHTRASVNHIGTDYKFINEDAILTVKPALGKAIVTYDHDQRNNIIPNGSFDETIVGYVYRWVESSTDLFVLPGEDITGQGGGSADITNYGSEEHTFSMQYPLPIDAHLLYKRLNWGFSFMVKSGFQLKADTGEIDWSKNAIKTSVSYTIDNGGVVEKWYLNEFGYWGNKNNPANAQVISIRWVPSTLLIEFDHGRSFFVGDEVVVHFIRGGTTAGYTIIFNETMSVQDGTDYIASQIPNSSTPDNWTVAINNVENVPSWNTAFTRKVRDYYKYIYFTVDHLKPDDVAGVTYTGSGALDVKTLDPGVLDVSTLPGIGLLNIEFYIDRGQHIILDDVWMTVNDNQDVYSAEFTGSKNSKEQEITMGISSAFSGFKISNLMRSYRYSNLDWLFTDGVNTGSLTELYARSVMQSRYKPSIIFNGTIYTYGKQWSFIDNYTIETLTGKKFIPINPQYNTEKEQLSLIAIESRNDESISLEIKHYGSDYNLQA